MDKHEALVKGYNYLVQHEWGRGSLSDGTAVCAAGALLGGINDFTPAELQACVGLGGCLHSLLLAEEYLEAIKELDKVVLVHRYYPGCVDPGQHTIKFNDVGAESKEAVLELFRIAIERTAPQPDVSFLEASEPVAA